MHDTSKVEKTPEAPAAPRPAAAPADAARLAREARYREHVTTLANPAFEGRAPGTKGNRMAADYVQFWFAKLGLKPPFSEQANTKMLTEKKNDALDKDAHLLSSGGDRSYRQAFVAPLSRRPGDSIRIDKQAFSYQQASDTITLAPGSHYNVLGYSASATLTDAPLVFVGYGIEDEDSDYFSFDKPKDWVAADPAKPLAGKVAVLLRFEPLNDEGKSRLTDDGRFSPASGIDGKIRRTIAKGAAGIILISPPGADDPRVGRLEDLSFGLSERSLSVPMVMMSQDAADNLLKAADAQGRSLLDLRKVVDETGELIDLPKTTVTLDVNVSREPTMTDNVGAILPGAGNLAREWIVIGSHYDHVGYGYFGSREPDKRGIIHPGADDNASGTSANLLLAERLTQTFLADGAPANRRSILFLAFSAEESGLNGARAYARSPIAPLPDAHALMINLDMVGRVRENRVEVNGTGTGEGMEEWTKTYFEPSHLTIAPKKSGLGPSDHNVFAVESVPVLFFFSGLHNEYHKTTDTSDLINVPGAVDIADLIFPMVVDAATRETKFAFTTANGRARSDAAATPQGAANDQAQPGGMGGVSVRFGVAPGDYSGEKPGVLIGEVFPDLPAAKAGLKGGDLMIKWNSKPIEDVEQWMPFLSEHKPGDVVEIVYIRDGKEETTKATLVARSRNNQ